MKIKLLELRKIIRDVLEEETWAPGAWMGSANEPLDDEELDLLGSDGFPVHDDDLEEAKKKGLWANIWAKRKRGERPAKPGEKGYPKTLNIDETDHENTNE